ncbi:MAG: aldose 1-epimerase family protein [Fusobacteriaceae bacterium]
MIKIYNEFLTVHVNLLGAEIREVINTKTGANYMWDGNKEIWDGVSPVLFPVVGKCNNNEFRFEGKSFSLTTNHGFARASVFDSKKISNTEVILSLTGDMLPENTFPMDFKFVVTYKLEEKKLITNYSVYNPMNKLLYFSVGAHPAFKCPFDSYHSLEDYSLEFEVEEKMLLHELNENGVYTGKIFTYETKEKKITLDTPGFDKTFVFSDFKSKYVILREKKSERKILVTIEGFKYIAFWKKLAGNFICIEPWLGKSDDADFCGDFKDKKDLIKLEANKYFSASYETEFDY